MDAIKWYWNFHHFIPQQADNATRKTETAALLPHLVYSAGEVLQKKLESQ
jgi:hypothetical protein